MEPGTLQMMTCLRHEIFLSAWFGTMAAMQSHHAGAQHASDDDLPYGMKYFCLHDSAQMAAMLSHHGSRSEVA